MTGHNFLSQQDRAHLWEFLAVALDSPPDAETVMSLQQWDITDILVEHLDGADQIQRWQQSVQDPTSAAKELRREFTRLFSGPRPQLQIHESYYAGDFLGQPVIDVKSTYRDFDIWPAADTSKEADHAAVELSALSLLLTQDGDVATFLNQHGWWIPSLGEDIQQETENAFYSAVGTLISELIAIEMDAWNVELSD